VDDDEQSKQYWQRFDSEWRDRVPKYDRSILRDPSSRKALASGAATTGNLAPGVQAIERGAAMLHGGNPAGLEALVDGFRWVVEAMDRHGYASAEPHRPDDDPPLSAVEIAEAAALADKAARRFKQGYEKAALDPLATAIAILGGDFVL
jgi:hypothetical protein